MGVGLTLEKVSVECRFPRDTGPRAAWEPACLNGWADPDGRLYQEAHAIGSTSPGSSLAAGL